MAPHHFDLSPFGTSSLPSSHLESDSMNPSSDGFAANILLSLSRPQTFTPSPGFLRVLFHGISLRNPRISALPVEIVTTIIDMVRADPTGSLSLGSFRVRASTNDPALTPPPSGTSPLMSLPAELRRNIFAEHLSGRDEAFHPLCDGNDLHRAIKQKRQDPKRKINKTANNIPNLMTLNRKICGEISEVMYEERTFIIHVHEGLKSGGVEILTAGRQPLQYQDRIEDTRFAKFANGEAFGFQRMKKIVIEIYPTNEDQDRHLAINTHFINLALCRLLERPTNDKERITSIKVEFMTRQTSATGRTSRAAIMRHEKPWMAERGPKSSSIHNVSDIELALRPFALLTRCHSAKIELPSYLADDKQLSTFVAKLEQSMMSKTGTLMSDDSLDRKVEQLRHEMEAHVLSVLHGNGKRMEVAKLSEKEMADEDEPTDSDSEPDEAFSFGGGVPAFAGENKQIRSLASANTHSSAAKRNKATKEHTEDEEERRQLIRRDLARVVRQSLKDAGVALTRAEMQTRVQDLIDSEDKFGDDMEQGRGKMKPETEKNSKSASSSLLDGPELAEMNQGVQVELVLQPSTGKTPKELGLRELPQEHPSDPSRDSPTEAKKKSCRKLPWAKTSFTKVEAIKENRDGEPSDDDDRFADLVKQSPKVEVTAETMTAIGNMFSTDDANDGAPATARGGPISRDSTETSTIEAPLDDLMVDIAYGTSAAHDATNTVFAASASTTAAPDRADSMEMSIDTTPPPVFRYPSSSGFSLTTTQQHTGPAMAGSTAVTFSSSNAQTPRTMVEAEDSGIGMLTSDDEAERRLEEKGQSQTDEEMCDAYVNP